MSNIKAIHISSYELDAIEAYLQGREPSDLGDLYEDLEVPDEAEPSQIEIAVAQILLHGSQKRLPQWGWAFAASVQRYFGFGLMPTRPRSSRSASQQV